MTELEQNLKSKIKVQNQNWDKGYGNYASGSAIIYNGSSYSFLTGFYQTVLYPFIDGCLGCLHPFG